jgi:hypothetical protein
MTLRPLVFFGAFALAVFVVFALLLRISTSGPEQGRSATDHRSNTVYRCDSNKRCDQIYPKP